MNLTIDIMKKFLHLAALVSLSIGLFSCAGKEEIKEPEPSVEGRYVINDGNIWADSYVTFDSGKMKTFSSKTKFVFDGKTLWHCSAKDFTESSSKEYKVENKKLYIAGSLVGEVELSSDGMTAGSTVYKTLKDFEPKYYSTISVESKELVFKYNDKSGSFNVSINKPITSSKLSAKCEAAWVEGLAVSGSTVSFSMKENDSDSDLKATIEISYEGAESITCNITQKWAATDMTLGAESATFDYNGGEASIICTIDNPREGAAITASTKDEWIGAVTVIDNKVSYTVEKLESCKERSGSIQIKYGTPASEIVAKDFTVIQTAMPVTSLTLDKTALELTVGESATLLATIFPADAGYKWTSDNSDIASVDDNGNVSAHKSGDTTIKVTSTDGSKSASCSLTVIAPEILSENGTANCYIITKPGYFSFDATVRGNGGTDPLTGEKAVAISGIADVKVLWETHELGRVIKYGEDGYEIAYRDGKVFFTVSDKFNPEDESTNGNALVAVTDASGKILWSWHLWTTKYPAGVPYKDKVTFMDRNLGAENYNTNLYKNGFIYQWGRKDPYPGGGNYAGPTTHVFAPTLLEAFSRVTTTAQTTVPYSIEHPTVWIESPDGGDNHNWLPDEAINNNLWGEFKTIYDPCPIGWMVPTKDDVTGLTPPTTKYKYNGVEYSLYFPTAGYGTWSTSSAQFGYGNATSIAYYWTSTSWTDKSAYYLRSGGDLGHSNAKYYGHTIRCVRAADSSEASGGNQNYDIGSDIGGDGKWSDN